VPPALAGLGVTAREVGVLALVAAGATNREIGEQLFISTRTVDKHVEHLLQKIGTSSRFGLAAVARDVGLIGT
jgi:DNA-binding NarL/FixJ family response regulator